MKHKKKWKIIQIISSLDPKHGGPPNVALEMHKFFNKNKYCSSSIITFYSKKEKKVITKDNKINSFLISSNFNFFSFGFLKVFLNILKDQDILIIHGLYTFSSIYSSILGFVLRKKMLLLSHGILDKHSINSSSIYKNLKRKIYLFFSLGMAYYIPIVFKPEIKYVMAKHQNSKLNMEQK